MIQRLRSSLAALVMVLLSAAPAWACAVCGGDKNSDMVKGALSGVVVMVAITYGVLFSFAAMMAACFVRARRMAARNSLGNSDGDITPS